MTSFTPVQIDFSLVASAMNAKINQSLVGLSYAGSGTQTATTSAQAQSEIEAGGAPPWRVEETDESIRKAALTALSSGSLISASTSRSALASDQDTPKIFAAYEALAGLQSLAGAIADGTISDAYADRAKERIISGIEEVSEFLSESDLEAVTLLTGERLSKAITETAIKRASYEITTDVLHTGDETEAVAQWAGLSGFTMTIDRPDGQIEVDIDLSSLADADRSMENVVDLINTELESAGAITRFSATKVGEKDEHGYIEGNDWALKITSSSTETVSFSTATDGPSLYMVGASGEDEYQYAQISKWTGLTDAEPTRASAQNYEANVVETEIEPDEEDGETKTIETPSPTRFLATATSADGSVFALVETEGDLDEQLLRGESDLALVKYDSTGREIWTRMVGATDDVTGASLAVADDGRIAIGGSTTGDLTEDAIGGGESGFVIMYNSSGQEIMTRQQGSGFDDEVTSLAFDSDGSLYVGGRTKGTLDDSAIIGGADAYVEKLDSSGDRVWINQFGTTGNDGVTALVADGSGGVIAATSEDGQAVMRSLSAADFDANDFTYTLGEATITSLAYDNGELYAAGETRLDGYSGGQITGASKNDSDAFAMRLDISGATATDSWYQAFDGSNDQSASSILVNDGAVFLAGTGEGAFGTNAATGDTNAFLVSLDSTDGAQNWASAMNGRGGVSSAAGIALSSTGDNDLDAFGLPTGKLQLGDVNYVSDRTSARTGDYFYISVDGGRQKKIELEDGDTYRSLTFKINAALVLDGQATARRGSEGQTLRIEPSENVQIELIAGENGQDLLSALGFPEGVVYNAPSLLEDEESSSDAPPLVALGLSTKDISLETEEEAQSVADMLETALRGLRKAYRYAIEDPTLAQATDTSNSQTSGAVSAYQAAQLANLQAGLARLQSGGTSTGVSSLFA